MSSGKSSSSSSAWNDPRVASLFIGEAELVGVESPRDKLISRLVEGSMNREVIVVVGMGGIGKTTLAKKVYDNKIVTRRFDCHAWIPVSQSYKGEELLKTMLQQFNKEKEENNHIPSELDKLIGKLRDYLNEKRYVVVFDDVWDSSFWSSIKYAFPDNGKGSRLVVTTRSHAVATSCKDSSICHIHELQPLCQDKAWELFCKKAFQSSDPEAEGISPSELKFFSNDILKKCQGLPLAIVTIGGILATKDKVSSQWQTFLDSFGPELDSNAQFEGIKRVLSLSYIELPYYLKACYLYFGIFPEDYSISCVRLMRLWIAEGFVKRERGKTLEMVAEKYLAELIQRSLVQVSRVDFDGKARSCRVHDLMREIIISISKKLDFCYIFPIDDDEEDKSGLLTRRRLSIHNDASSFQINSINGSSFRSVFRFDKGELPESFVHALFTSFKLLKILDFEDAPLQFLPNEVGDLFHLSYLSVRNTKTKALPVSIGRLQNLLTLDLKQTLVFELPSEIKKLRKLRHLLAYHLDWKINRLNPVKGVKIHKGFGCLEALQKLYFVEANHGNGFIEELKKLRQLRKLGIKNLKSEDGKALCSAIEVVNHLESLDVSSIDNDNILDLQHIVNPPQSLRRLYLTGRLQKFPEWISKLTNVVRIRLFGSGLTEEEDPLKFLEALPNLLELGLFGGYDGGMLHFKAGGFKKLKLLRLRELYALNSMIIDDGVFPLLEELSIGSSPQLKDVPSGIQHLRKVTTLRFYDMDEEFLCKMLPKGGPDYSVVEHIPIVLFSFKDEQGNYTTYTLR